MFILGILIFFIVFITVILIGDLLITALEKIIRWYEKH